MKKGDEASQSIILASRALLAKMLITLKPHGIFGSNCVYLQVHLILSSHWYEKSDEASPGIILTVIYQIYEIPLSETRNLTLHVDHIATRMWAWLKIGPFMKV